MADQPVEAYYSAIDEGRYDDLRGLLAPEFVHDRPDRTIDGPDTFVGFMRDDRPLTDTRHTLEAVCANEDDSEFAVRGTLLDADGDPLFGFVDVHTVEDGTIARIETYTN
ncbi:nuclear transport factor 2 family protein [Halococcus sp. IIIV-5B]|uniref:nuclear transport factor 2 family protein n=1 Tax=Halococcus sp. IIIV-5B TaxID=2321230 RepID=UPI000E729837|nr:nuclear transport factor 2 family protein [Halococcus sp. IIIV-5B]RJT04387.1 ketosteroid isomerase [Halococcus sp. IIIV-5B]